MQNQSRTNFHADFWIGVVTSTDLTKLSNYDAVLRQSDFVCDSENHCDVKRVLSLGSLFLIQS